MDLSEAESYYDPKQVAEFSAKFLAEDLTPILTEFFGCGAIQQLEAVQAELDHDNALRPMIKNLIEALADSETQMHGATGRLGSDLYHLIRKHFKQFLHLSALVAFFDSHRGPTIANTTGFSLAKNSA